MFEFCFCSDGNVLSDRKKNTIYNPTFFLLPIVFLCTFKPTDLKMVILFWFDFLALDSRCYSILIIKNSE